MTRLGITGNGAATTSAWPNRRWSPATMLFPSLPTGIAAIWCSPGLPGRSWAKAIRPWRRCACRICRVRRISNRARASPRCCTDAPLGTPWSIRVTYSGTPGVKLSVADVLAGIRDVFTEPARALALVRGTSRNAGALYMFIAREVIRVWDATGEQVIREGVRGIGRERGSVLREKHQREGKPLNLKTLMLDW